MFNILRVIFKRFGCLHEWIPASPLLYGGFSRGMMVCRKCGKKQLVEDTK